MSSSADARLHELEVGQNLELPAANLQGKISVEEAISQRRSERHFSPELLTLEEVSQLLWSAQGMTSDQGLRAAPSAGACYPLELYLVCSAGLFRYLPERHTIAKISGDDLRPALAQAAGGQSFIAQAPASLVVAAVYGRTTGRYGERGARYVHIDVGHLGQNVHLQAVALGLGSVPVGAFADEEVERVLGLPSGERALYIIPVGHLR